MRNIEDIIQELRNHPDMLYLDVWTKDDILNSIYDEFYNSADDIFGDDWEDDNFNLDEIVKDLDIENQLTDDEYKHFKGNIAYWYERMFDIHSHYGDWTDRPEHFENWSDEFKTRIKRHILLSSVLKES